MEEQEKLNSKKYYEEHKEELHKKMRVVQRKHGIRKLLEKLNNKMFERFPYSRIEKYGIKFDKDKDLYYI